MTEVFLLGAGFSKAISKHMPVLNELSQAIGSEVELPAKALGLKNNVEHMMTYLAQPQPWMLEAENLENKAAFLKLAREIATLLQKRSDKAISSPCPEWLIDLLGYWHKTHATVITLNYDALIEQALELVEIEGGRKISPPNIYPVNMPDIRRGHLVFGPSELSTFNLLKLHGSINWYYSGASSYFGETIYSGPVANWGDSSDQKVATHKMVKGAASDKVPLIIPPTSEKVAYFQHESIRRIWSRAGEALTAADHLYCIGYSLPATDLSIQFFLTTLGAHGSVLSIVNKDVALSEHYQRLLGSTFSIDENYVGENTIQKLVADLKNR